MGARSLIGGAVMDKIPMSERGRQRLEAELEQLETVRRPQVSAQVAEYRAHGDLSENAPYHAAREELGMTDAKIGQLKDILNRGFIVDRSKFPEGMVVFGTKVVLSNCESQQEETWLLVGEGEQDPDRGFILTTSPLGQSLMTRKLGEEFEADLPGGTVKYKVKEVSFYDDKDIS